MRNASSFAVVVVVVLFVWLSLVCFQQLLNSCRTNGMEIEYTYKAHNTIQTRILVHLNLFNARQKGEQQKKNKSAQNN